jgi:hypothetical protein
MNLLLDHGAYADSQDTVRQLCVLHAALAALTRGACSVDARP